MLAAWIRSEPTQAQVSVTLVRWAVALVILMHPLHGYFHAENIPRFGEYLSSLGFPFGGALAWAVLLTQTAASLLMLAGRLVVPACAAHVVVLLTGIVVFHYPLGWYVVGPGEGGMEFSVLMISCLLAVAWAHWPRRRGP
ncbi:DoxX family protein [Pelomonas sp. BJYL3]|uniref:DoxX family protein n=1 Tax=Pelomonas sp. BJYL3 TaxID=2976697 RepID=UPI0022B5AEB5|nr:DoxX family protein [Pelomonas sp. BJYL3]